jgi:hypothetical protein
MISKVIFLSLNFKAMIQINLCLILRLMFIDIFLFHCKVMFELKPEINKLKIISYVKFLQ